MLQGLLTGLQGLLPAGMAGGGIPGGDIMGALGVQNMPQSSGGLMGLLGAGGQLPSMAGMMPQSPAMGTGLPAVANPGFDPSVVSNDILGAVQDPSISPEKFIEMLGMMQMASANTQQAPQQAVPQAQAPGVQARPAQIVSPYGQAAGVRLPGPLGGR